jgi:SH3-like domain-containing protein
VASNIAAFLETLLCIWLIASIAMAYHNWRRILEIDLLWGYVGNGAQHVQVLMADFQLYSTSADMVYDITSIHYRAEAEEMAYTFWLDELIQAELEAREENDQSIEESDGELTWITVSGSDGDASVGMSPL